MYFDLDILTLCHLLCRMHLALKAYHELMQCVSAMDQSQDSAIYNSAKVIKS